jgi:hypothetical protein
MSRLFVVEAHHACATVVILSLILAAHGAECPNSFSGLTTCAVLNGFSSVGSVAELENLASGVEVRVADSYDSLSMPFVKDNACKTVYEPFLCWQSGNVNIGGECIDGTVVPSSVTMLLACSEWCTAAMSVCMPDATPADIHEQCSKFTFAPPGHECMHREGVRYDGF